MSETSSCAAATAKLASVRQLLLEATPENMAKVAALLQEAVDGLRALPAKDVHPPAGEVLALGDEVRLITALLHHAGRFHLGWASLLAASGSEYGLAGAIFPEPPGRRVSVDG